MPEPLATVVLSLFTETNRRHRLPAVAAANTIYLGLHIHKDSITIAVLPNAAKAPTRLERLPNDLPRPKRFPDRCARDGVLDACYEASGAGCVLHRAMREWGYACTVIASSLIPTGPACAAALASRNMSRKDSLFRRHIQRMRSTGRIDDTSLELGRRATNLSPRNF